MRSLCLRSLCLPSAMKLIVKLQLIVFAFNYEQLEKFSPGKHGKVINRTLITNHKVGVQSVKGRT